MMHTTCGKTDIDVRPGTIADISPEDIVSLDILKDASATAIYG